MKEDEKHEYAIHRLANMWWQVPLTLAIVFLPNIMFLWGYFRADGWISAFPFLSSLGAPLFVALGLYEIAGFGLTGTFFVLMRTRLGITPKRRKMVGWLLSAIVVIIVIVIQKKALVLLLPTASFGYKAAELLTGVILDKPSLRLLPGNANDLDLRKRQIYERCFITIMAVISLLNVFVAFQFSIDTWVIWKVAIPYATMILIAVLVSFLNPYEVKKPA